MSFELAFGAVLAFALLAYFLIALIRPERF